MILESGAKEAHSITRPLSASLEYRVLQSISGMASTLLERLPESTSESQLQDEDALTLRFCAVALAEERRVLNFYKCLANIGFESSCTSVREQLFCIAGST